VNDLVGSTQFKLTETFNEIVVQELRNKEVAALMKPSESSMEGVLPGGIINRLGVPEVIIEHLRNQQHQKGKSLYAFLLEYAHKRTLELIRKQTEYHLQQLEITLQKIQEINDALEALEIERHLIEEILREFQKTGKIALDEDGQLVNPSHKYILDKIERTLGYKIGTNSIDIYEAFLKGRAQNELEAISLKDWREHYLKEYKYHNDILTNLQSLETVIQDGNRCEWKEALDKLEKIKSAHSSTSPDRKHEINPTGNSNDIEEELNLTRGNTPKFNFPNL
jgi:hypothetical protein